MGVFLLILKALPPLIALVGVVVIFSFENEMEKMPLHRAFIKGSAFNRSFCDLKWSFVSLR